jgi:membrane protein implicated in regulation of membrane protease activity
MCACGCFLVLIIVAALVYSVMHGLWLAVVAVVLFAAVVGWFGQKAAASRKGPQNGPRS